MGFFRRGKRDSSHKERTVTFTVEVETHDEQSEGHPECDRIEIQQRQAEGRLMRARALSDAGVDLEQFSESDVIDHSIEFLDEFIPLWRKLSITPNNYQSSLDPLNLTKSGKIPKNVVEGRFSADGYPIRDSAICQIKYMADGTVNMADLIVWHDGKQVKVSVRTVGDEHRITSVEFYDLGRDFRKLIYSDRNPKDLQMGESAVERVFEAVLSGRI